MLIKYWRGRVKGLELGRGCDGTSRHLCSLSVSLLLLCACALDWFSLSVSVFLSRSFITHHLIIIIVLLCLVVYYTYWFFLSASHSLFFFFVTVVISHLYIHFCTPVLCSLSSSCSSFYSIHSWVSFTHHSSYHHLPPYCGIWDSI
jgi:hypothetical protein